MKTYDLQKTLLDEIAKELEKGNVPIERIRGLAKEAVRLTQQFPNEVPPESMMDLVKQYPEITLGIRDPIRNESEERDEDAAEEVRKSLGLRH